MPEEITEELTEQRPITESMQRALAIRLFNATWDLIDKQNRSASEDDSMINSAHASLYH